MKLTRKQAMDQYCYDCGHDDKATGSKRQQVEWCKDTKCSLYEYRPVTGKTMAKNKKAKYDALSPEEKAKVDSKADIARERFAKLNI